VAVRWAARVVLLWIWHWHTPTPPPSDMCLQNQLALPAVGFTGNSGQVTLISPRFVHPESRVHLQLQGMGTKQETQWMKCSWQDW
jgi:hypothetical protein